MHYLKLYWIPVLQLKFTVYPIEKATSIHIINPQNPGRLLCIFLCDQLWNTHKWQPLSESNSTKNRPCQDPVRFQNFVIVMINQKLGMTRIWMQKKAGSHDWQAKLAERQILRTLLCICSCHLLSNFRFQQFKPQDVKFVIVLQNLYELWAVGLAFGGKPEAVLNTRRIAWNKPLGILLNMQCFSRLLIGRLLLWWFNRNAIHNRVCFKHSLLHACFRGNQILKWEGWSRYLCRARWTSWV